MKIFGSSSYTKLVDDILVVEILDHSLKAINYRRGKELYVYVAPDPVVSLSEIDREIAEAIIDTDYKGSKVYIVYYGSNVEPYFLMAPNLAADDLKKYVAREVEKEGRFKEGAMTVHSATKVSDTQSIIYISIMRKSFFDSLVNIFLANNLYPHILTEPSVVISETVRDMKLEMRSKNFVLMTKVGGKLIMYICMGKNCDVIFERSFSGGYEDLGDQLRISREAERSVLFAKQQYDIEIDNGIFLGDFSDQFMSKIGESIGINISKATIVDPHYISTALSGLNSVMVRNFIPKEILDISKRIARSKFVLTGTILLWVLTISLTFTVEYHMRQFVTNNDDLSTAIKRLNTDIADLRNILSKKELMINFLNMVANLSYIPGWFVSYLGVILPDGIAVTYLKITTVDDDQMRLELSGVSNLELSQAATKIEKFEKDLVSGPYRLKVQNSWNESWLKGSLAENNLAEFKISGFIKSER